MTSFTILFLLGDIMNLEDLWWFLGIFLVIYIFYLIFGVLKRKKFNVDKIPVELRFLIKKYHLDMSKINYRSIMNMIGLASSFVISFTATFIFKYIENELLMILIGGLMIIPLIFITFNFIGLYYRKKGCVTNGNKKN